MSLAETRELMQTMKELMALLNGVETKTQKIVADLPKTKEALTTFRQIERLALRWLAISRQLGLPEDVAAQIDKIARLIVMIRMAQMSINMLMMSNPLTAGMGLASLIMTATTLPSTLEGY